MVSLAIVPRIPERPADLIRVAVPRLNKCDHIEEYLRQIDARDYDVTWARVTETKVLTCAEWNQLMHGLLEDREWLAGKGGCSSWAFDADDDRDFFKLTEAEREIWKKHSFLYVVAVQCAGQTLYIDPEGYNYARYLAFPAAGIPEGKTREQLRKEEAEREQARKLEELKQRIANPPEVPETHGLRFLWNGVKHNGGQLFKASYSMGTLTNYPENTITVYAEDYHRFPVEVSRWFHVENHTDSQSDYFDDDKFRACPNHPLYGLIKAALDAQEAHHAKRLAKRFERKGY